MSYLYNTPEDQQAMLDAIGCASIEELFAAIPDSLRLQRPLHLPEAMGELQLTEHLGQLAAQNRSPADTVCFLGAGSYDHFIPAVVDYVASRGEFYTSYTPYQPEVSQGNLQAMFEYQTMVCELTAMDVSNQSLYDGGSATVEGVLMSLDVTRRRGRVLVAESVHPEYRQVVETYFAPLETEVVTIPCPSGIIDQTALADALTDNTACLLLQHPNFFGCLEEVHPIVQTVHASGALIVSVVDPISLGILERPGDYGADIVVGEGQSLGTPMQYGGPYLGLMACRESFVRRLPGRIAGQTIDRRGNRCWVLTLQTREQHIRRDKATSNICSNQGLFALRASVYLAAMGPVGLRSVAELCLQKTAYARQQIAATERLEVLFEQPVFKEFVIRDRENAVAELMANAEQAGIFAGVPLGRWYPDLEDCFLFAVTEKRSRRQIDRFVEFVTEQTTSGVIHAK
ncbi:MAG: aminomethyl-transferring glycine dehydrogenase subunit GcvPA [Planctomycetota bacterium]|nr:aminomethyl-transferring glycine dehydrogenase subunit GcvPA [Planctomycetota bacterium]